MVTRRYIKGLLVVALVVGLIGMMYPEAYAGEKGNCGDAKAKCAESCKCGDNCSCGENCKCCDKGKCGKAASCSDKSAPKNTSKVDYEGSWSHGAVSSHVG